MGSRKQSQKRQKTALICAEKNMQKGWFKIDEKRTLRCAHFSASKKVVKNTYKKDAETGVFFCIKKGCYLR